ncbi:MAG: hypothetical protein ACRDV3_13200 [Acidothermaceae bacterium]
MLKLRDARTGEVSPVALARAGALRVHVCTTDLRSLLVADLVRRAATLSHDLVVRVTTTGTHPDAAALNIHPTEAVDGEPDADLHIGCTTGPGLLIEAGAVSVDVSTGDPLAVRLALLDIDYRKPVDLDDAALGSARATLSRWRGLVAGWARSPGAPLLVDVARRISAAIDNDLDTSLALQALLELERADSVPPGAKFETFAYADRLFGLDLARDIR